MGWGGLRPGAQALSWVGLFHVPEQRPWKVGSMAFLGYPRFCFFFCFQENRHILREVLECGFLSNHANQTRYPAKKMQNACLIYANPFCIHEKLFMGTGAYAGLFLNAPREFRSWHPAPGTEKPP